MDVRPDLAHYAERFLLEAWPLKLLLGLLAWLYGPWQEAYGVLIALVVLDTITGIWAAKREGHTIRSAVLRTKSLTKVGFYAAALMMASLAGRITGLDSLLDLALTFAIVSEALSVAENLIRIYPEHPLGRYLQELLEARTGRKKDPPAD
jgi:phage-related holin